MIRFERLCDLMADRGSPVKPGSSMDVALQTLCTEINRELTELKLAATMTAATTASPKLPKALEGQRIFASWKCLADCCPDRKSVESPFALVCYTCGEQMAQVQAEKVSVKTGDILDGLTIPQIDPRFRNTSAWGRIT